MSGVGGGGSINVLMCFNEHFKACYMYKIKIRMVNNFKMDRRNG